MRTDLWKARTQHYVATGLQVHLWQQPTPMETAEANNIMLSMISPTAKELSTSIANTATLQDIAGSNTAGIVLDHKSCKHHSNMK
jgi:hypothetical protein